MAKSGAQMLDAFGALYAEAHQIDAEIQCEQIGDYTLGHYQKMRAAAGWLRCRADRTGEARLRIATRIESMNQADGRADQKQNGARQSAHSSAGS